MGRLYDYDYAIRIPLKMIQLTECDGKAYPLAFNWEGEDGAQSLMKVDKVYSRTPCAEQQSGVVGDRYDCLIAGRREELYYSLIAPRKWFKLKPVTEEEYKAYYRLPGERQGTGLSPRTGKSPGAAAAAGRADPAAQADRAAGQPDPDRHAGRDGHAGQPDLAAQSGQSGQFSQDGQSGPDEQFGWDMPSNPGYAKDPKIRRRRGIKIAEDPASYGADLS